MNRLLLPLLLIAGILCAEHLVAASPENDTGHVVRPFDTIGFDAESLWHDGVGLFVAPTRWSSSSWAVFGGVLAADALVMTADQDLRTLALSTRGTDGDKVERIANRAGNGIWATAGIGVAYLTGLVLDIPWLRRGALRVFSTLLRAALVSTTLKMLAGRARPWHGLGQWVYHGPGNDDAFFSLPSGHSTVAFAVAASLAREIDHPAATIGLYSAAAAVGFSRMYADKHWGSDVLLGAAIGTSMAWWLDALNPREGSATGGLMIIPGAGSLSVVGYF